MNNWHRLQNKYDDYRRRSRDLDSLLRISQRYSTLEQMLTDMALEPPESSQNGAEPSDKDEEKLVLSTIHSAKGLEWHTVFVIHLVEGFFPSTFAVDTQEQLEEERRLFYVAATRARRKSSSRTASDSRFNITSPAPLEKTVPLASASKGRQ